MCGLYPREDRLSTTHALYAVSGPIATLTFNRPEARNAMTWDMYQAVLDACDSVDNDPSVRVLVLRGAGGKAFVAGTDIAQFQAFAGAADGVAYERDGDRRIGRLEAVRKPVIAAVQGFAVGAGLRIAAACDLRIATPDSRFGAPIARTLGNCLSAEAYARLVDLIGPSLVTGLLFTAKLLPAAEAHAALVVTPEYNGSIPGVLKNAIDWLSRPFGNSALKNKPLAVVGTAAGQYGGVWAHDETRKSFGVAGPRVVEELKLSVPAKAFDGKHPRENAEVTEDLRDVVLVGKHELIYVDERTGRHRGSLTDNMPALAAKPAEADAEADEAAAADDEDLEATGGPG